MEGDNANMQNENMDAQNPIMGEDEIAFRRNQVLMFGVVLLGILAICLAVSMPSDMEFNDSAIPSSPMSSNEDQSNLPNMMMTNLTNSTQKSFFKNPEDSVENRILRNIAIQKAIKGVKGLPYSKGNKNPNVISKKSSEEDMEVVSTINPSSGNSNDDVENVRVDQIVETFMNSEDFEDFIIDVEINDAIQKMRKEKGYKKRDNTIFDDLFKQIEKQFLGDDPVEVRIIRKVGEELEKRAREILMERKKNQDKGATNQEELIAGELYLDYESKYEDIVSGSGNENGDEDAISHNSNNKRGKYR